MKRKSINLVFLFLSFFFICSTHADAQMTKNCASANSPSVVTAKAMTHTITEADLGENSNSYGGTFQFVISGNAKAVEIFTDEVLKLIEENRLMDKENIISLSPNTKVRILSKDHVSSPDFKPFDKLYIIE